MVASETISVLGRRENGYYTKEKKPGCARNQDVQETSMEY